MGEGGSTHDCMTLLIAPPFSIFDKSFCCASPNLSNRPGRQCRCATACHDLAQVGELITEVLDGLVANGPEGNGSVEQRVRDRVRLLCQRYPIYDR